MPTPSTVRPALAACALAFAAAASAQPAVLYAEAVGATGAYAIGVERAVWTADAGERQLRLRAGASYWTDRVFLDGPRDRFVTVPVGASALFTLGRPLDVPAAFEASGGVVLVRLDREGSPASGGGARLSAPAFAELAVRLAVAGRVGLRVGAAVGGVDRAWGADGARPVVGLGVGL